jgi:tripartite-type tricarboxylate transporter receptor subunit TctC
MRPQPPRRCTRQAARALGMLTLAAVGCGGESAPAAGASEGCAGVSGETVRWIVTSTAGGGLDVGSRLLEPFYETAIGAQLVVENRTGAGGTIGARAIRDADPDGSTLGMLNGTARIAADVSDDIQGLHPLRDFTVLGRIAIEDPVWVTRAGSPYQSIEDVLAAAAERPLLFGISDVGGSGFVNASIPSELLGLPVTYVAGYPGGREFSLGLIRDEFDLGAFSFESQLDHIESGELIPILQISDRPVGDHPALQNVPVLAGENGVAARAARRRGEDPAQVIAQATALAQLFQVGRIVVAPPGLDPDLARCLSDRLADVAADPAFLDAAARANRTIRFADPEQLASELTGIDDHRESLASILERHIEQARSGGQGS